MPIETNLLLLLTVFLLEGIPIILSFRIAINLTAVFVFDKNSLCAYLPYS